MFVSPDDLAGLLGEQHDLAELPAGGEPLVRGRGLRHGERRGDRHRDRAAGQQRQDLAAVIHLCGAGAGNSYANRGFRLRRGERCGDHNVRRYLAEVNALKRQFARLIASGKPV